MLKKQLDFVCRTGSIRLAKFAALVIEPFAMHSEHTSHWSFIDYPGIGFHLSLRSKGVDC